MREFQKHKLPAPRSSVKWPDTCLPIDVEIGAGAGMHALQYSKDESKRHLIAIERTKEKFRKMEKQFQSFPSKNTTLVHADAINWLCYNAPKNSLSRVYILYPNPEPNNANQRWPRMPFLSYLIELMGNGSKLCLATNIESYYKECLEGFPLVGLEITFSGELNKGHIPRTHFEKKYLERAQTCFEVQAKKP